MGRVSFNYLNQNIPGDKMAGSRWHSWNDLALEETEIKKREVSNQGSHCQPVKEMGLGPILLTPVPVFLRDRKITQEHLSAASNFS